jgi:hypothetical protein
MLGRGVMKNFKRLPQSEFNLNLIKVPNDNPKELPEFNVNEP